MALVERHAAARERGRDGVADEGRAVQVAARPVEGVEERRVQAQGDEGAIGGWIRHEGFLTGRKKKIKPALDNFVILSNT